MCAFVEYTNRTAFTIHWADRIQLDFWVGVIWILKHELETSEAILTSLILAKVGGVEAMVFCYIFLQEVQVCS